MTINAVLCTLFIGLISGSIGLSGAAAVRALSTSWLVGQMGASSTGAAVAADSQPTLYVNGAVATSGDAGRTHDYFFQFTYGNGQSARWPEPGTMPYPQFLAPQGYLPLSIR